MCDIGTAVEELPEERRIFGTEERPPQDHFIFLGTGAFLVQLEKRNRHGSQIQHEPPFTDECWLPAFLLSNILEVPRRDPRSGPPFERTKLGLCDWSRGRSAQPGGGWPSMVRGLCCRRRPSECRGSGLCLSQCVHLAASIFRCAARAT